MKTLARAVLFPESYGRRPADEEIMMADPRKVGNDHGETRIRELNADNTVFGLRRATWPWRGSARPPGMPA